MVSYFSGSLTLEGFMYLYKKYFFAGDWIPACITWKEKGNIEYRRLNIEVKKEESFC
ncbi:MAG: hypothetical protein GX640_24240 [Fibrobacter sp.]|nr:hypothetical protein [Fibrobacter sp.]